MCGRFTLAWGEWRRQAGPRALVDGLQSHPLHQALHPLPIDHVALRLQPDRHSSRPVKRRAQVLAVEQRHQFQRVGLDFHRRGIPGYQTKDALTPCPQLC